MNTSENPDRDRAIFAMRERGKPFDYISKRFELSGTRVRQIYLRELKDHMQQRLKDKDETA